MYETILVIVASVVTFVVTLMASRMQNVLALLAEVRELLGAVLSALQDSKLTTDEVATIVKEAKDVLAAAKEIGKKD
jgi:hypothetical protein